MRDRWSIAGGVGCAANLYLMIFHGLDVFRQTSFDEADCTHLLVRALVHRSRNDCCTSLMEAHWKFINQS